jgi:cellobiose phosphorylase
MKYGHFSKDGKEYIVENVATPKPWINYLYNDEYFSTISNNGGGISYHRYPLHGRITRYRINDVPYDRPGKYIYIKDNDTGEIWSLTWQPVGRDKDGYKVAHGFGYTRCEANIENIASEVVYFVPQDDNVEIWKSVLTNKSDMPKSLSVYAYVEFALGHAMVDLINQCDDQHFNRVNFEHEYNALFASKTYWITENGGTQQQENKAWDQWVYFTSNLPVAEYETVRERFIGLYHNENNPQGIEDNSLSSKDTDFGNAVGVLRVNIQLAPGEKKDVAFSLGIIPKEKIEEQKEKSQKYQDVQEIEKALLAVQQKWEEKLGHVNVQSPDENTTTFLNYWTQYQAQVAFDVGRVASFYYWGISRGFGFRDTAQDTIAVTISDPAKAKERICLLARQMFTDGSVYHHYYRDGQGEKTGHCDDPLWFVLAVTDYIKETGDFDILQYCEPFVDAKSGTILEHLESTLIFIENILGHHNLPIFGRGDWNDTLDYIGGDDGGESVWGGMFYIVMINLLIELLEKIGEVEICEKAKSLKKKLIVSINEFCWDGEWFIRAFGANDRKIGSKENDAGKIFLNTQSWAVIGEVADKDMLVSAMDSVKKHLDTDVGPKICAPAFREIDESIGLITRCVAGKKENASVFYHPTTWAIQAECLLGRGNNAYEYYQKLLPSSVDSDVYQSEPYVYPQYVTSDEHETEGMASHSWQTGTAAWMFRICVDYMLGVRATYGGLLVDPVISSDWKEFSLERVFRGTRYKIQVSNPDGVEQGVKEIFYDGQKIDGNVLPVSTNKECIVTVKMG